MLDALRGIAALAVLLFHTYPRFARHGYLAVDLFFVLSGFVMANAYQERLDGGWPSREFLRVRLVRLYPLYCLGLITGLLFSLAQIHAHAVPWSYGKAAGFFLAGLFFLPTSGFMFPLDGPLWSLFFEGWANVIHAFAGRRRSIPLLLAAALLAAFGLLLATLRRNSLDIGIYTADILTGFCRVAFSYTVGMVLQRLWARDRNREYPAWVAYGIAASLVAALVCPVGHGIYDLLIVTMLFPWIVYVCARASLTGIACTAGKFLGRLSYAVYVLQVPVIYIFARLAARSAALSRIMSGVAAPVVTVLLVFGLAWLADRYDQSIRAYLTARR